MTPPDKPEHQQGSAAKNAERTSVMTQPVAGRQEPGQHPEGSGAQEAAPPAGPPREEADPPTERETPVPAESPAATGSQPDARAAEQADPAAAVPPPWQRVPSDAQYVAEHAGQQVPAGGQPVAPPAGPPIGQPAGQPMAGPGDFDPEATVVNQPTLNQPGVVTGTAAGNLFGGPPAGFGAGGSGRTAVNLGPAAGRSGTAAPSARRPGRGPRRASLQVKRVDPWSVLKLAGVLSVAMFFIWMVAVGVLYGVLDGMGVWDKLNGTYNDLVQGGTEGSSGNLISVGRVFGVAAVVGVINIILFTALATVSAFIYNVSADLAGGLEVTLSERE